MQKVNRLNQRYGHLLVIGEAPNRKPREACWLCRCDCGKEVIVRSNNLNTGNTTSCGCSHKAINKTHGMTRTPIYQRWRQMIQRCTNPRASSYERYGGRGIQVCDRWRTFQNFYEDMGDAPEGCSIDRINSNGNYEPNNCRWATATEQSRNTRRNRMETLFGRTQSLASWADELGISYQLVHARIRRGWTVEKALTISTERKGGIARGI